MACSAFHINTLDVTSQLHLILLNHCSCKVTGWFSVHSRGDLVQHASGWADVNFWIVGNHLAPASPAPASATGFPCPGLMAEMSPRAAGHCVFLTPEKKVHRKIRGGWRGGKGERFLLILSIMWKKDGELGNLGPTCSSAPPFLDDGSNCKESACNAGDLVSIPGSGRSPGEGNGYPLPYSCLENPMDRGAWRATVHGVTKSGACLRD